MIEDPCISESIPDADLKFHVDNISSAVKIEGTKNYIISYEDFVADIERK